MSANHSPVPAETLPGQRKRHIFAIFFAAIGLCWPAFLNRYPLLYPDSITYIGDGRAIAAALFLHRFGHFGWQRSAFYSLGILPLHWNRSPWPIVGLHALLTAWVLWLVVRSIVSRGRTRSYLLIVCFLSALSSVAWFASFVVPDILGPALYLSIYLLVFARETLSRTERWLLAALVWWGCLAHSTHLLLGVCVCVLLGGLLVLSRRARMRFWRGTAQVSAIVVLAVASQLALNLFLFGRLSLDAGRPPLLMARVIADGPGRLYLEQNCPHLPWSICKHVANLPESEDDFLWLPTGIFSGATEAEKQQLRREEMPLVLATVRAFPREQLRASLKNAWQQLLYFEIADFGNSSWMESSLNRVMPGAEASYRRSLQSRNEVPSDFFSDLAEWTVGGSLLVVVGMMPLLWRWRAWRLCGMALIVLPVIGLNAVLTGALSGIDARYQARVVWLVPLLAVMVVVWGMERYWVGRRAASSKGVR
ncbi:hypothetical protein [Granulicella mallensis]|uniref:Glycosyltransferase RgtA/B/C/D-like domain-containing protein n=1 Tax=Granulicella mallensis (strain ATCC BAA-1857 / DSM 23137 / MP5ACTX8) TaxID=682795 RepID=G8NSQ9_GRAMM|nr:hypothetical protein [Granulicella mallensis]AEU35158.1 hypothetical protein AciX8_0809 [Granulicella mallensis MP5ACTX8]